MTVVEGEGVRLVTVVEGEGVQVVRVVEGEGVEPAPLLGALPWEC